MEDLRLTSFEDFQDKNLGKIGTPERDAFEKEVDDALQAYRMGEVIKQARKARNLTQEQLGAKIGVQKSQISRLERGHGIPFTKTARLLNAMNVPGALYSGGCAKWA